MDPASSGVYADRDFEPTAEEFGDVRLSAAERQAIKALIAAVERCLGVDGLMFAAAGFEAAAVRRRAEESRRA